MTFQKPRFDVDDFPVGCRVKLPTGRTGVVLAHKGYESRQDAFMRVMIRLDGGDRQGIVQLQPHLLRPWVDGLDRIQSWEGDYFQVGDNVRLPTGRTGVVLALMPMRKTESIMFLLIGIDGDGGQQDQAELPVQLVEKLPASWVPPKRPELPPVRKSYRTLEQDYQEGFPVSSPQTEASKPVGKISIARPVDVGARSPDAQVLQAIQDAGYDPVAFPRSKTTRKAKAKRLVKAHTDLTRRQFDHAWRRLCADGRIVERRITLPACLAGVFVSGATAQLSEGLPLPAGSAVVGPGYWQERGCAYAYA